MKKLTKNEFIKQIKANRLNFIELEESGYDLNKNGGYRQQICYKSGKVCPYACSGLCKDSY